jgi:hypothetical protein
MASLLNIHFLSSHEAGSKKTPAEGGWARGRTSPRKESCNTPAAERFRRNRKGAPAINDDNTEQPSRMFVGPGDGEIMYSERLAEGTAMRQQSKDVRSMATRHVQQGVAHVARQRELIHRLRRGGYDTSTAETLLRVLEDSLWHHRTYLARVTGRRTCSSRQSAGAIQQSSDEEADPSLDAALRQCSADILNEPTPPRLLQALQGQPERSADHEGARVLRFIRPSDS